ncbi:MAG: NAD(P)(+) transhydrogenase (Re/Si-specific) subunit beta [Thermaerobacter sp.]|nr:NAD(P)(+) transhydrogenase (Re/Si-specific) subunit beta [Thermaerobacter sp.]
MADVVDAGYLAAAVLFILGVMLLRSPATARRGNYLSALGMLVALVSSGFNGPLHHAVLMLAVFAAAAAAGVVVARTVRMTAMPQLVALFNGTGGGAAALVALLSVLRVSAGPGALPAGTVVPAFVTLLVGSASLAGSAVAVLKLQGIVSGRPLALPGRHVVNGVLLLVALALMAAALVGVMPLESAAVAAGAASLALGLWSVLPIGGADMPVVISLLNALTGLAAAATGFVLANDLLIVAGALVGASGTILTLAMGRAMHRSLGHVLFGHFQNTQDADGGEQGTIHPTSPEEVALLLAYAQRVVVVPGYGMAVSRAQKEVKDLCDGLAKRGVDVRFGIHPVAGRMPGHMNVLLAEANVPYDQLYEMERINPDFPVTDVVLVIGANDVVNPAARSTPGSPLYGMPVLNVDQAKTVVVLKRSMAPGFAGVENQLFGLDKTLMLFGDARAMATAVLQELLAVV